MCSEMKNLKRYTSHDFLVIDKSLKAKAFSLEETYAFKRVKVMK